MRRLRSAIVLAVLASGILVPAAPVSAGFVAGCASVNLRGVGLACARPDGLFEFFGPKTGRSLGLTHGPDASRPEPRASVTTTSATTGQRPVVCADASDYHVEIVYARASDDTDQYATRAASLRKTLERVNYWLNVAGGATGSSADYKVLCAGGVVTVWNVVLPTPKSSDGFGSIVEDLAALGHNRARTKYLVMYDDGIPCGGCGGLAQTPGDDRRSSDNGALRGPSYAVVLTVSTSVMMHELSHTMGAVMGSAPHSTGAAHCYDGADIMCYNDGGPRGSLYTTSYCTGFVFDCNKDDYFNTNPAAGSYLATHWNLGSRLNRYIKLPPAPDTSKPSIAISEPRTGVMYLNGCSGTASITGSGRPAFHGRGCLRATATDLDTGVDRLDVYFDGKLISTQRQFPMSSLSFDLGRGPGLEIPLTLVATDFAEIPSGPNVTTTTLYVDVL